MEKIRNLLIILSLIGTFGVINTTAMKEEKIHNSINSNQHKKENFASKLLEWSIQFVDNIETVFKDKDCRLMEQKEDFYFYYKDPNINQELYKTLYGCFKEKIEKYYLMGPHQYTPKFQYYTKPTTNEENFAISYYLQGKYIRIPFEKKYKDLYIDILIDTIKTLREFLQNETKIKSIALKDILIKCVNYEKENIIGNETEEEINDMIEKKDKNKEGIKIVREKLYRLTPLDI